MVDEEKKRRKKRSKISKTPSIHTFLGSLPNAIGRLPLPNHQSAFWVFQGSRELKKRLFSVKQGISLVRREIEAGNGKLQEMEGF